MYVGQSSGARSTSSKNGPGGRRYYQVSELVHRFGDAIGRPSRCAVRDNYPKTLITLMTNGLISHEGIRQIYDA